MKNVMICLVIILNMHILLSQEQPSYPSDRIITYDGNWGENSLPKRTADDEFTWEEMGGLDINYRVDVGPGNYSHNFNLYIPLGQVRFVFYSSEGFVKMEIKYDGGSWNVVRDGYFFDSGYLTPPFITMGVHTIELKYLKISGGWATFYMTVYVVPSVHRRFFDNWGNMIDVWQGGSGLLDRPLLFVEGFDPPNTNYPVMYYALAEQLMTGIRNLEADVMILNFAEGGGDMRANAQVVTSAVEYINGIKVPNQDIIVTGISMGGPVCRYALAEAEENEWKCELYADLYENGVLIPVSSNYRYTWYEKQFENIPLYYKTRIRGNDINDILMVGHFSLVAHFNGMDWKTYFNIPVRRIFNSLDFKNNLAVCVGENNPKAVIMMMERQ